MNEALDLILDCGPEEDENIGSKKVIEKEANSNRKIRNREMTTVLMIDLNHFFTWIQMNISQ